MWCSEGRRGRVWYATCFALAGAFAPAACELYPIDLLPSTDLAAQGGAPVGPAQPSGGEGGAIQASGGAPSGGQGGAPNTGGMGGDPVAPPPPDPVRVLMVVDDLPISTDDAIENRLGTLPLEGDVEVVRLAEAMTTPGDTDGFDLVIVSSSADSGGIGGSLKDVPVPMLVLEPNIFNLMGLGPQRTSTADTEMTIVEESHPIAHGMTGTLTICGRDQAIVGQALQPGGVLVARAVANTNVGVLVAYEQGTDVGGLLPERRVSFGALKLAPCQTETSWGFFDAAVRWLIRQN